MKKSREKELDKGAEKPDKGAERIQNTISLLRKLACALAVIAIAFMFFQFIFFHAWSDYNNYTGSQLVLAEVIDIKGANNENIVVVYRYNIAGEEYESNKVQHPEKIKKGDKKEIRVKKGSPEVILKYNDVNLVIFRDVIFGLCLGLTVLCLYEIKANIFPSAVEEIKAENVSTNKQR